MTFSNPYWNLRVLHAKDGSGWTNVGFESYDEVIEHMHKLKEKHAPLIYCIERIDDYGTEYVKKTILECEELH